jgi:protein-S-isoprenylcysteine O-methyltransferase Ste14
MRILKTWLFAVIPIIILPFTRSAWEQSLPLIPAILYVIGLHLAGIGAVGRLWCSLYIAGYKDSTLIQQGPYSLCRNPLYFFSFVGAVGVGMATETFTVPLVLGISFLLYYPSVIGEEEVKLRKMFPDDFDDYCARVPRFFPHHVAFEEPKSCTVNPRIYRRHIFSALWFILIVGWLDFFEDLHEMGLLPVFFHLY